ncbi:T9SS type A sorting domain-containing protein [Winogradskyella aurantiaca]|uniref:T9SS type A sorting domain-containing protein n=1 Tax=Winogradskyella aurantiaca TaxID=2219558 RepID=UPI000E1C4543|nr:T9SS type A sorting domain-containing protein [Winogradskyella aurantiaca]
MKTITYSFKRLIPALCMSLALSVTGFAQMTGQPGAFDAASMEYDDCYGVTVVDYIPGDTQSGNPINDDRNDPMAATGEPDRSNAPGGFVSLGKGGTLILGLAEGKAIFNTNGTDPDIQIWETTYGGDTCSGGNDENATISVSVNGINWREVGTICRDGAVDISESGLPYVKYIRIVDSSAGFGFGGDGYDVDGIEVLSGCSSDPGEESGDCEEFNLFYAHNGGGGASSEIYTVAIGGGVADFSDEPIIDMDEFANGSYRVHISYDEVANVIYTARNDGSELIAFGYNGSEWVEVNRFDLEGVPGGIVQNVFYRSRVYLGSSSSNDIYEVDPLTGDVQHWEISGLNINGGDLTVINNVFYSASRSGRKIYEIKFNNDGTFTGSATVINNGQDTPAKVNGMAASIGGNFLMANDGSDEVYLLDSADGSQLASYVVDSPFGTLLDGDLASGCASGGGEEPRDPCDNYKAFYANHNGGDTTLYRVTLDDNANTAALEEIATLGFQAHIALNTDDGYIYAVNEDTDKIYKVNPNGGTIEGMITLSATDGSSINSIYAMTYFQNAIYLGSANLNQLYRVQLDGSYEMIAAEIPVQGGDLVHRDNRLHLATRAGNKLYRILGGDNSAQLVGTIASKVNGLALNASDDFITTHFGKTMIYRYGENGEELTPYATDGFQFENGDLASGCTDADPEPLCDIDPIENPGAEGAQEAKDDPQNNDFNNGWHQYSSGSEPEWLKWSTTTSIEIQETGRVDGNASYCGNFHFELLSRAIGDNMYQVIDTNPGATVYVNFWHKKRRINGNNPVDEMEVLAGDYDTFDNDGDNLTMLGDVVATSGDDWVFIERSFVATSDKTVVMLRGLSGTTVSVGNLIDNVYIGCDEDGRTECDDEVPALVPHTGAYSDLIIAEDDITLYPVPAISSLNIQVDNEGAPVEGTYYITSINGRVSHQGSIQINNGVQSSTIHESVETLPDGMYFLVMEVNGNRITKQFVKTNR